MRRSNRDVLKRGAWCVGWALLVGAAPGAEAPCHPGATEMAGATQPAASSQNPAARAAADHKLLEGGDAFDRGDIGSAMVDWRSAADLYAAAHCNDGRARALRNLAAAYQSRGLYSNALASLIEARQLLDPKQDPAAYTALLSSLGTVYTYTRQYDDARSALDSALKQAKASGDARAQAGVLNNLGNLYTAEVGQIRSRIKYSTEEEDRDKQLGDAAEDTALNNYAQAARLSAQSGDANLEAKALANAAVSAARDGRNEPADQLNRAATAKIASLPQGMGKANLLVSIGRTDADIAAVNETTRAQAVRQSASSYQNAIEMARRAGDFRAEAYAVGYLGRLYEQYGRTEDAQSLARRAVFLAQKAQDDDSLYRWQWLNARLLKKQGQLDEAIAAYARAIHTERGVQTDKAQGFGNGDTRVTFRKEVAPVFYQAADLLLRRAALPGRAEADVQADLRAARDTIEQLKTAELQDYFKDPCDNKLPKQEVTAAISPNTAIVYIIPLEDRIEILLDLPTAEKSSPGSQAAGEHRLYRLEKPTPIGSDELERTVDDFRRKLERRATNAYVTGAAKLYDWLIRPIEPVLKKNQVHTLVFVPDGSLRSVPMAALYDGDQFLIQKYAVAVTPSLTLTDPKPLGRRHLELLVNGLSEARQGYAALPNVRSELASIVQAVGASKTSELLNGQFLVQNLADKLRPDEEPYSIVHIASHGEFRGDVRQTFVLAWDAKLTVMAMQKLMEPLKYKDRPIELITLSACQTAAGDDRAALGLAGFAIKAGARSAVASLWFVNDASSVELIAEFYRQLYQNPDISKAEALRRAQVKLLEDPDFSHPIYWAPYLVIGNWL